MHRQKDTTTALADYFAELLQSPSKDICISMQADKGTGHRFQYAENVEILGNRNWLECEVSDDSKANAKTLREFLTKRFMEFNSKSKAILASGFEVSDSETSDLSMFLLPEFKKLQPEAWGELYSCAIVSSLLGESGRAVVRVPLRCFSFPRYDEARKLLFKSGLVERVVYMRAYARTLNNAVVLVFSASSNHGGGIGVYDVTSRSPHELQEEKIADAAIDDLLENSRRLNNKRWAYHIRFAGSWNAELGEAFNMKFVRSYHRLIAKITPPQADTATLVKARVLSPADFSTGGLLIPLDETNESQMDKVIAAYPDTVEPRRLRKGDVLVSRVGKSNIAYVAPDIIATDGVEAYVAGDNLIALRPGDPKSAPLICSLINGRFAREQITASAFGALAHLSSSDLLELYIPDTSREEDLLPELKDATEAYFEQSEELVMLMRKFHRTKARLDNVVEETYSRQRPRSSSEE